ncbi:hypothetical protein CIK76_00115 [Glutamicibacter sp. BW80]|nr:hypothetical protein CIK76_00115 [Glutamicibacter sp. BW80]PCC31722.1 hypothetical protein CIK74_16675 [Glutamicibacter sp. BW77]
MNMEIIFRHVSASDPAVELSISEHLREMSPTAPPESRHALNSTQLGENHMTIFAGYLGGQIAALGALRNLDKSRAELKSMRTAAAHRGRGLGRAMLERLIGHARATGISDLYLETGTHDHFIPARQLYASAGFTVCEPFGSYAEDPHSVFMHRRLD